MLIINKYFTHKQVFNHKESTYLLTIHITQIDWGCFLWLLVLDLNYLSCIPVILILISLGCAQVRLTS